MPLGTDNLKKLITLGLKITKQIQASLEDKKFQLIELVNFIDELMLVPGVVSSWEDIKAEWQDLEEEERVELHDHFALEFDIPNDKVEAFIENALLQGVSLIALVEQWKDLKNPVE